MAVLVLYRVQLLEPTRTRRVRVRELLLERRSQYHNPQRAGRSARPAQAFGTGGDTVDGPAGSRARQLVILRLLLIHRPHLLVCHISEAYHDDVPAAEHDHHPEHLRAGDAREIHARSSPKAPTPEWFGDEARTLASDMTAGIMSASDVFLASSIVAWRARPQ